MPETVLDVPLLGQELSLWCWAAIASGLSAFIEGATPMAPCRIASGVMPTLNCCKVPDRCNAPEDLDAALAVAGISCLATDEISFERVADEILSNGRPVPARIEDENGRGHFILVVGCNGDAPQTVVCADPNGTPGFPAPRYRMKYSEFEKTYGGWGKCTELYLIGGAD